MHHDRMYAYLYVMKTLINSPKQARPMHARTYRDDLTKALFEEINAHLAQQGLLMRAGTIVGATIIAAPISTKTHARVSHLIDHFESAGVGKSGMLVGVHPAGS